MPLLSAEDSHLVDGRITKSQQEQEPPASCKCPELIINLLSRGAPGESPVSYDLANGHIELEIKARAVELLVVRM